MHQRGRLEDRGLSQEQPRKRRAREWTMELLTTALVSAGVAAFIALLIEWFAKPVLDAKKDRILARAAIKREVSAGAVRGLYRFDDVRRPTSLADREAYDQFRDIASRAQYLLDNASDREAVYLLSQAILFAGHSDDPLILSTSEDMAHRAIGVLHTPRWRRRKRAREISEIKKALDEAEDMITGKF